MKAARDGLKEELSNAQKNYEKNRLELEKVHQAVVTELSDEKKTAEKAAVCCCQLIKWSAHCFNLTYLLLLFMPFHSRVSKLSYIISLEAL